jgi:hypothetical protein
MNQIKSIPAKRGPKPKKGWTIKCQRGIHYLYTWEFNIEKTKEKRRKIEEEIKNGTKNLLTDRTLWNKASTYDEPSQGRIHFKIRERVVMPNGTVKYSIELTEPSPKFLAYISKHFTELEKIRLELEERLSQYESGERPCAVMPVEVAEYLKQTENAM